MIADQWGISPRGPRRVLGAEPPAGGPGHGRGPLRERDRPRRRPATTRATTPTSSSTTDEGIRPDSSVESLAKLKPAFRPEDGKVTAGNSSQITDGASAVLIMSEEKATALGPAPRGPGSTPSPWPAVDPITMLTGPIPATATVLERAKLTLDDIDAIEINEAFASVVLAWEKEHHPDMDKVNLNGGAIALGHPLGASGAKLMATLLNELERTDGRYGLLTMCEGGGMANATIIERLG